MFLKVCTNWLYRRQWAPHLLESILFVLGLTVTFQCEAQKDTRIGLLFPSSGPGATLGQLQINAATLAVEEINASGGVLGSKVTIESADTRSTIDGVVNAARYLMRQKKVSFLVGPSNQMERDAIASEVNANKAMMLFPGRHVGGASPRRVVYTGADVYQLGFPAVDYLRSDSGGSINTFVLLSDRSQLSSQTVERLRAYLEQNGVQRSNILSVNQWSDADSRFVSTVLPFVNKPDRKAAIVSVLPPRLGAEVTRQIDARGLRAKLPFLSLTLSELDLQLMNDTFSDGQLVAATYFMSLENVNNKSFLSRFSRKSNGVGTMEVLTDDVVSTYLAVYAWKGAVERAQSTDVEGVLAAMVNLEVSSPSGGALSLTHRGVQMTRTAYIGVVEGRGVRVLNESTMAVTTADECNDGNYCRNNNYCRPPPCRQ